MAFLSEPPPERGKLLTVEEGRIWRVVAPNPGPMTYHGTNTYLIVTEAGLAVLDPGPDAPAHVEALLHYAPAPIRLILLSHTHPDHVGGVAALKAKTGAPLAAYHTPMLSGLTPDIRLDEGDEIAGLGVLHTPGHAADHLCFTTRDGLLFSADHVMAWSTSVVSPPGGDMAAYVAQLRRLAERREDRLYLPGHGPALPEPQRFVADLLAHREAREQEIFTALALAPAGVSELAARLYAKVEPTLRRAAERNVLAHLLKLEKEGRVIRQGELWQTA
jgi:glyoxylase-like metal-dependent hydrolase (beta-lactamase superfamily II)